MQARRYIPGSHPGFLRSSIAVVAMLLASQALAIAPATRAADDVAAPARGCRLVHQVHQSPTEVLLRCRFDWPAIAAAGESDRLTPLLGYVAVPNGARASLAVAATAPASPAQDLVHLSPPARLRGIDVVGLTLDLGPAGVRNLPELVEEVELRVSFTGGDGQFGESRLRSRLWEPLLERWVLNHGSLPPPEAALPCGREGGCEFVIIAPDEMAFTAWADSLKSWRTLQGITTEVFTTAEIGTTWQGIKDFLANAYFSWPVPPSAFLLLADYPASGDGRQVGIPAPIYNGYTVSDNLYADVDGDGLPDMFHGRITAHTGAEVGLMVGKLLDHERAPCPDPGFYAHPLLAAGWDPDGRSVMELETLYGFQANTLGLEPVREYVATSPGSTWPDPQWVAMFGPQGLGYLPPTPEYLTDWGGSAARINADINDGAFMVIHRGVGSETAWGDPLYTVGDVAGLNNANYPFVFSMDCLTGRFNSPSTCLTEALHRSPHGTVGMISAAEVCYSLPTSRLMLYLLDALWPQFLTPGSTEDPLLRPGQALLWAKYVLAQDAVISPQQKQLTYHLFHYHGDPISVMNCEVPQPLSVEHADCCLIGDTSFTVQADEGALIGLTVDGDLIGVGTGTGLPEPIPIIAPTEQGTLRITATKQNRLRYDACVPIRDASAVPEPGPALAAEVWLELASGNPLLSAAHFRYAIPPALAGSRVTLSVHDAAGRCVRMLFDGPRAAGVCESRWDGANDTGAPVGSGIYFARLTCGEKTVMRRIARVE